MKLEEAKREIALNGGFTVDAKGRHILATTGYMVSLPECETITTLENLTEKDLQRYMKLARKNRAYFGAWLEGNKLYLDVSTRIGVEAVARKMGKKYNQEAIYDLRNNKTIYIK